MYKCCRKMTVGKIPTPPVSLFCVIYDGLTAALNHLKQSNRSAFPWPCPAFCSSLIQTHSISWPSLISPRAAEARAEKEESGPHVQKTVPFSCLPAADRQLRGRRSPETMRGIFGAVIWRTHGTHTKYTLRREEHTADPRRPMVKRGLDAHRGTRPFIHTPPLGSVPTPPPPPPGRRPENTHGRKLIWKPQAFMQMLGQIGKRGTCLVLPVFHTCQSHVRLGLIWAIWNDFRSCRAFKHLCEVLTVPIAGPFKRFTNWVLKIRVAAIRSANLRRFGFF